MSIFFTNGIYFSSSSDFYEPYMVLQGVDNCKCVMFQRNFCETLRVNWMQYRYSAFIR